ncbi:MAG: hypothetical protein ACI9A8_002152, partial [Cryomorphaceae bacterium]
FSLIDISIVLDYLNRPLLLSKPKGQCLQPFWQQ